MSGDVERVAADYRIVQVTQVQRALDAAREAGAAEVRARVEALHRPSGDRGKYRPYCLGCWEAGGEDGAPLWPCPTIRALTADAGTRQNGPEPPLSRPNPHSSDSQDPRDNERGSE
jgi:hypothetical protein